MSRAALALGVLVALGTSARADDAPTPDTSQAQHLFDEGRALLDAGKTDEACEKFEQSIAKDPRAVGTLLNLGLCNERRGKPATALALFQEAFDRASEANLPTHRDAAQKHIALLQPQIPVLVIHVPGALADESVFVDDKGVKLDAQHDKTLQLDPGPHKIVASAPGHLSFETSATLAVGTRETVAIPPLEVPHARVVQSSRRLLGKIATIGGGVLIVGAGALAGYAHHRYHGEFGNGDCAVVDGARLCNAHGHDVTAGARNVATAAGVIGAVGAIAIGTGLALWLTAPAEDGHPRVVPIAGPGLATLSVVGSF